jgi:c-di-GMP-binding flagellar brake protein YcgR
MHLKEAALKIEYFYNDEDIEFHISSKREKLSILQSIADQGSRVALYYGSQHSYIATTLLGVNEHGLWLDVGPYPPENKQLLLSNTITLVTVHQHVKVQFEAHDIQNDLFENDEAFYLKMPDFLLRLQRREFFRTAIPSVTLIKCVFPVAAENPDDPVVMRAIPLVDISGGGIGLFCGVNETALLPDKIFTGCHILIPEIGNLATIVEVRNCTQFTSPNKVELIRVGCRFIGMNNQDTILLQRYITRLQSESRVKQ